MCFRWYTIAEYLKSDAEKKQEVDFQWSACLENHRVQLQLAAFQKTLGGKHHACKFLPAFPLFQLPALMETDIQEGIN